MPEHIEQTQKRWLTLEQVRQRFEEITQTPTSLDRIYKLTRPGRRNRLKTFRWGKTKRVTETALQEFIQQQENRL